MDRRSFQAPAYSGPSVSGDQPGERSARGEQGFWLWFLQRISGVLLLFFVLAHGTITHFVPIADVRAGLQEEPVTHEVVEQRLAQGAMLAFDFALLGLALYHGLNGIRGILLEWSFTARRKTAVTAALHTIGLGAFALGAAGLIAFVL